MRNDLRTAICLVAAIVSGAAYAESASDSLTRIEAETMVLKAREKQLDVQSSIMAKQNDIIARQHMREQLTQNAVVGDPVIRSVEGIGKRMYAALQLADGSVVDVAVGDTLSNGMRVVSIRANEVIVENGKRRRTRLATASHVQQQSFNPTFPNPGVNLVPLPPVVQKGIAK